MYYDAYTSLMGYVCNKITTVGCSYQDLTLRTGISRQPLTGVVIPETWTEKGLFKGE